MRFVLVLITIILASATAWAQQSVPPPPQPPADKPPAAPQPAAPAPAASGPSLEATMKYIQDKVNQQGSIVYVESSNNTLTGESVPAYQVSSESLIDEAVPAGGLSLEEKDSVGMANMKMTWRVYFKDVEKLEVLSSTDYNHRESPAMLYQDDPPFFVLVVHLAAGKTVQQHIAVTLNNKENPAVKGVHHAPYKSNSMSNNFFKESDKNVGEFALHFRDEDTANRVAKAMIHAIELCGGGSQPELF